LISSLLKSGIDDNTRTGRAAASKRRPRPAHSENLLGYSEWGFLDSYTINTIVKPDAMLFVQCCLFAVCFLAPHVSGRPLISSTEALLDSTEAFLQLVDSPSGTKLSYFDGQQLGDQSRK
jgi:hypothetical protein